MGEMDGCALNGEPFLGRCMSSLKDLCHKARLPWAHDPHSNDCIDLL